MKRFEEMSNQFINIPEQVKDALSNYIDNNIPTVQQQYDNTIAKVKEYWYLFKNKINFYFL